MTSSFALLPSTTLASSMSLLASICGGPPLYHHCGLSLPQPCVLDLQCQIPAGAFPCRDKYRGRRSGVRWNSWILEERVASPLSRASDFASIETYTFLDSA
ncbi:hypothetical protein JHK86_055624 [Glycine max]|nr:hypothetical protein JHK86_055624 [Glycine max]